MQRTVGNAERRGTRLLVTPTSRNPTCRCLTCCSSSCVPGPPAPALSLNILLIWHFPCCCTLVTAVDLTASLLLLHYTLHIACYPVHVSYCFIVHTLPMAAVSPVCSAADLSPFQMLLAQHATYCLIIFIHYPLLLFLFYLSYCCCILFYTFLAAASGRTCSLMVLL